MNDKKILTESELYNQGARYCSVAEHCLSEARAKLMRETDDEALIGKVLERLVENGYINERRYAQAFVHDKFRFAKWGKRKIQQALRSKGISETDYLSALEELEDDGYREALCKLIESKRRSVKGRNEYEIKMKLARFAASRGFESSLIFEVLGDELPDESF